MTTGLHNVWRLEPLVRYVRRSFGVTSGRQPSGRRRQLFQCYGEPYEVSVLEA